MKNIVLAKIKPKSFLGVPLEDRCSESKINARLWIKQKRMLMCGAENNETTSSMADILSNLIIASSVVLSMHWLKWETRPEPWTRLDMLGKNAVMNFAENRWLKCNLFKFRSLGKNITFLNNGSFSTSACYNFFRVSNSHDSTAEAATALPCNSGRLSTSCHVAVTQYLFLSLLGGALTLGWNFQNHEMHHMYCVHTSPKWMTFNIKQYYYHRSLSVNTLLKLQLHFCALCRVWLLRGCSKWRQKCITSADSCNRPSRWIRKKV